MLKPTPWPLVHGKIVFHETGPWYQKGWGLLEKTDIFITVLGVRKSRIKALTDLALGKELNPGSCSFPIWWRKETLNVSSFCSKGFPGGSDGKESACNAGDPGSFPDLGRSSGEGNGNPFQYSFLENSMDRGAWQAIVHGDTKHETWLID